MNARTLVFISGALVVALLLFVLSISLRTIPQPIFEIKGETLWEITIIPSVGNSLGTLEIRNTLVTSWCIVAFVVLLAYVSGRNLKEVPSGWQNFIEGVIDGIRGLVVNTAGEQNGRRFFWVIATFLIYIAISNWFALLPFFNTIGKVQEVTPHHFHDEAVVVSKTAGLSVIGLNEKLIELEVDEEACAGLSGEEKDHCTEEARAEAIHHAEEENGVSGDEKLGIIIPYFRSVNTDLMTPLSLAIASAIFVEYWGISALGLTNYGSKFFTTKKLRQGNPMGAIDLFVGFLEFIAEVARLISFSFRLFGNMLAGEILLLVMTFMLPFAFFVVGIFYGLEIFVGAIQAFVFGMLTLVFAVLAVSGHGDHEEEHATGEGSASAVQSASADAH
jgi:F-type H+-transporting ATPase subunit a